MQIFKFFIVILSFQRDHNLALRFEPECSARDQPPPTIPGGPAHEYEQFWIFFPLLYRSIHSIDVDTFSLDGINKEIEAVTE